MEIGKSSGTGAFQRAPQVPAAEPVLSAEEQSYGRASADEASTQQPSAAEPADQAEPQVISKGHLEVWAIVRSDQPFVKHCKASLCPLLRLFHVREASLPCVVCNMTALPTLGCSSIGMTHARGQIARTGAVRTMQPPLSAAACC